MNSFCIEMERSVWVSTEQSAHPVAAGNGRDGALLGFWNVAGHVRAKSGMTFVRDRHPAVACPWI
jgi:hypothetical protein